MIKTLKDHIQNREKEKLVDFISNNPEVLDQTDENGASGLLLIAYGGIKEALDKGAALKKSLSFHEAVVCGKVDRVIDFLKKDPGVANVYSADGFTPLSLAAFFDQPAIAKLLLENGADPARHATNPSHVNALHAAVAKNNYELCERFIEFGVNVNDAQTQNITPLHSAAHKGNLPLVKLLVENGAEINRKADSGMTAIDFAEKDGHTEVKAYLEQMSK